MFLHMRTCFVLSFVFLFLGIFPSCSRDYVTGKSSYNWYSIDQDVSLGNEVLASQMNSFQKSSSSGKVIAVDVDEKQLARLQAIVNRIAQISHLPTLPYEVHLADLPVANAWAAPGGKIMVYSGLWDPKTGLVAPDNDDELAAVLSHEIAHATARHVTESLSTQMTLGVAGTLASTAIGATGSAMGQNLFGQAFSMGQNIYVPTYSRKNEYEADKIGLFYMAKAGYDPRAAIEVWKRAAMKKGGASSIFASHPASGERAKKLEFYLPQAMEIYQNPELPLPNFARLPKPGKKTTSEPSAQKNLEKN